MKACAVVLATAFAATVPAFAGAITKNPKPLDEDPWEVTAAFGLGLTDGNSDTLALSAQILASYFSGPDEVYLGADFFYGKNESTTTTDNFRAFATWNHLLTDRLYTSLLGEYLHDDIANLDYRVTVSPGIGYYLLKTDMMKLGLEAGVAYVWEQQDVSDSYFALRFGERFEWTPDSRVKIWQSLTYVPEAGDFGNYNLVAELGVQTALSDHWALRTFVRDTYDSTPSVGSDENDIAVLAGLSYSLKGFAPAGPASPRRSLKPPKASPSAPGKGWASSLGVGFSLTSGNSDTLGVGVDFDSAYRGDEHELFLHAGGAYGEQDSNKTNQNVRASIQYNKLLSERLYVGAVLPFLYDEIADIDYRISPSVLVGNYFVKTDRTSLAFEAGAGYTFEKVGGANDDYFTLLFAEKFATKITDTVTFAQSAVYQPDVSDFENFTVTVSAMIEADINDTLSVRTTFSDVYDNQPAAGRRSNDLQLTAGFAVKF